MKMDCNVFSFGVWSPLLTGYLEQSGWLPDCLWGCRLSLTGPCYFRLRAIQMKITMSFWFICIVIEPILFYGILRPFPEEKSHKKEIKDSLQLLVPIWTLQKKISIQDIFCLLFVSFSSSCHKKTFCAFCFPSSALGSLIMDLSSFSYSPPVHRMPLGHSCLFGATHLPSEHTCSLINPSVHIRPFTICQIIFTATTSLCAPSVFGFSPVCLLLFWTCLPSLIEAVH